MLLCDGNSKILEETILYAALDVFAKCLGSKFFDKTLPWTCLVTVNPQTECDGTRACFINAFQSGKHVPQGLKPAFCRAMNGTAEAVPYPKPIYETRSRMKSCRARNARSNGQRETGGWKLEWRHFRADLLRAEERLCYEPTVYIEESV